jgi:hypothetical protein
MASAAQSGPARPAVLGLDLELIPTAAVWPALQHLPVGEATFAEFDLPNSSFDGSKNFGGFSVDCGDDCDAPVRCRWGFLLDSFFHPRMINQ